MLNRSWVKTGAWAGLSVTVLYLSLAFLPLPLSISRYLFFALGVVGIVFVVGLFHLLRLHRDGVMVQIAALFGIIAMAVMNLMAVVQVTVRAFMTQYIREAESEETKEMLRWIYRGVDSVQLGLDISFDIFLLLSLVLFGIVMLRNPYFGVVFGGIGVLLASATLVINMYAFPVPPGSKPGTVFDLGPVVGVWLLAVSLQMLRTLRRISIEGTST